MKINSEQLPVKAHYFFFMAAMGPILPFLPVYGKQLGVSALVMGSVTAVLPILFLITKPAFGFLVDHYRNARRMIFSMLVATTSCCFILMYFLPSHPKLESSWNAFQEASCSSLFWLSTCKFNNTSTLNCIERENATCRWSCNDTNIASASTSDLLLQEETFVKATTVVCYIDETEIFNCSLTSNCNSTHVFEDSYDLYTSATFWIFIILMSTGNIGFNISNCISDAICFDILGEGGQMGYGRQRVWGTIGFGIAAFLAGYSIDLWSQGKAIKTYTPAFFLVFVFSSIDLLCCRKLTLPIMSGSGDIVKDVYQLLKSKPVIIFLCFATLVGILDSFLIYFLFWYLEDLAAATGYMSEVKLIEGLTVAAETLGGEVIFFSLSGKILKKFGYGYSFAFCLACYALRFILISLASTPWWLVAVELAMQGPTYALGYTTIVAYASAIAPSGTSATVQGIVAGMDDGLGYAIGSFIGGYLYKNIGGLKTLHFFAIIAATSSALYLLLHVSYLKHVIPDTRRKVEWKSPDEAHAECTIAEM